MKNREKLKQEVGIRLNRFRQAAVKVFNHSTGEFSRNVKIPMIKMNTYEKGELFPEVLDFTKLTLVYGLNLNWLFCGRGSMFCHDKATSSPDSSMGRENDRYEKYKFLLQAMQIPVFEDLIFKAFNGLLMHTVTQVKDTLLNPKIKQLLSNNSDAMEGETLKAKMDEILTGKLG